MYNALGNRFGIDAPKEGHDRIAISVVIDVFAPRLHYFSVRESIHERLMKYAEEASSWASRKRISTTSHSNVSCVPFQKHDTEHHDFTVNRLLNRNI